VKLTKAQRASVIRAKAQRKARRSGKWSGYQRALDRFVSGLKADGAWDAFASFMMPGPTGFADIKAAAEAEGEPDG